MEVIEYKAKWYILHRCKRLLQMKAWREQHPNYFMSWRQKQIVEGKCARCGAPLIEGEDKYCMACFVGRHIAVAMGVL